MEQKKIKLENKVSIIKSKIEAIDQRNRVRKDLELKKREKVVEFLNYQEQNHKYHDLVEVNID